MPALPPLPHAPLVLPPEGDTTLKTLKRRVRVRALRWLMSGPLDGVSPALARRLLTLRRDLAEPVKRSPAAALAAVGSPDVLAPLLALSAGLADPQRLYPALVPNLLAGLARFAAPGRMVLWDWPVERVVDLAGGRVIEADASAALLTADSLELRMDGAATPLSELPGERRFHPFGAGLYLSTWDSNPLADMEAHPDKSGNALDLGGRSPSDWTSALGEATALIQQVLPELAGELPAAAARMLPVGYEPERHFSASYREAPGLAYLTLHPDTVTLAEAIIHETQHNKLNRLMLLAPPLTNGQTTWTPSPVRPDLRPLDGVLLAVHAFIPVAALHERLAATNHPLSTTGRFPVRRHEVLSSNARGMAVLVDKAAPTEAGATLLRDLKTLHEALLERAPEPPDLSLEGPSVG